jgi:hypothetical protein
MTGDIFVPRAGPSEHELEDAGMSLGLDPSSWWHGGAASRAAITDSPVQRPMQAACKRITDVSNETSIFTMVIVDR